MQMNSIILLTKFESRIVSASITDCWVSTITEMEIIRVGTKAESFKADQEAFDKQLNDLDKVKAAKGQMRQEKEMAMIKEKWPNLKKTDSGLMYQVENAGSGEAKPNPGDTISAHYTGMFLDGSKFDSSVDRGDPIQFPVGTGRVIKGWDEALLDMKKGKKESWLFHRIWHTVLEVGGPSRQMQPWSLKWNYLISN